MRTQYWVPRLEVAPIFPKYRAFDEEATFKLGEQHGSRMRWIEGQKGPQGTNETAFAATWIGNVEYELLQSHFFPYKFPFDTQTIKVSVTIDNGFILGCHNGSGPGQVIIATMRAVVPQPPIPPLFHPPNVQESLVVIMLTRC